MSDEGSTRLRPVVDADLDVLGELRNDLDVQLLLLARPRPNSPERVRQWVSRLADDPAAALFAIADRDDACVGFVQLTAIDAVSSHARLGIAVAPEHRRRGHAAAAIAELWDYGHRVWGLRKLVLDVRADNRGALDLYEALGFERVGVHREHFRDGDRWHDVVVMERLG
ncbi:MAG: GNAT family protein [Acidimicrobiales bacterium]